MFYHAMRGDSLSLIIWSDPSMFHDAVSPWSLHIYHYEAMQGRRPHFPPTRKATIHIHTGERGKGVKICTLHWGGCLPNLDHIYYCIYLYNIWYTYMTIYDNKNIVYQYIISAHTWSTTSTSFFRAAPPFGRRPKNVRKAHFCCQCFCALVRGRFCFVSVLCFWACFSTSILHHVFGWDQKRHWAPGIWNA